MRPQRTPVKGKAKKQSKPETDISDDETQFQSPDFDDATDYGLEFTTSRITPRRHPSSTLRKPERNPQRNAKSSDEDQRVQSKHNLSTRSNQQRTLRTSPRFRVNTTQSQSQRQNRSHVESDEDEEVENQPPTNLPTKRSANQQKSTGLPQWSQTRAESTEESSYSEESQLPTRRPINQSNQQKSTAIHRSTAKAQQTVPQKRVAKRKQSKPEHRAIKLNREINRLRALDRFLIPRLPFSRVVRELLFEQSSTVHMITMGALEALQTSCELYLTQRFEDAYLLTKFRGRVTLEVRDMAVVAYFCRTYSNN